MFCIILGYGILLYKIIYYFFINWLFIDYWKVFIEFFVDVVGEVVDVLWVKVNGVGVK